MVEGQGYSLDIKGLGCIRNSLGQSCLIETGCVSKFGVS